MNEEILKTCADNNNYTIYTAFCKAQRIMMRSYSPVKFFLRIWKSRLMK